MVLERDFMNIFSMEEKSKERKSIRELSIKELQVYAMERGYPKYVGSQIFDWLHNKFELDFNKMSNLSQEMREFLKRDFYITSITLKRKLKSGLDNTVKYLFELHDGHCVEAVAMKYKFGYTLCISTQVGCKMGCRFCASSVCKFVRNLGVSEMMDQIILAERDINQKINNLVLMGIGEPLDNLDNVIKFLKSLPTKFGVQLSLRRVTVSTCGLVDKIYELMKHKLQVTLTVSLHAPTDELRNQIMPVNKKWNLASLMKATDDYFEYTSRRVSFEYTLINGFNDSAKDAEDLVKLLGDRICHVNLIPLNDIKERNYNRSSNRNVLEFQRILRNHDINVTVRRELGSDINAACGQLRLQELRNNQD